MVNGFSNRQDISTVEKLNKQLYALPSIESMERMLDLGRLLYREAFLSTHVIRMIGLLSSLDPYWESLQTKDDWSKSSEGLCFYNFATSVLERWESVRNYEYYIRHIRNENDVYELCYRYGFYCLKIKSYSNALKWLRIAADNGVPEADCAIGQIYLNGFGVSKSLSTAFVWFEKAAERGIVEAQYQAAIICYDGIGVAQNLKKAARFFKMGAENGSTICMYWYAHCLCEGEGTGPDYDAAAVWYLKAASDGHADAQYELALLLDPEVDEYDWAGKDDEQAAKWYLAAAEQDVTWAQYVIAGRYAQGKGIAHDEQKASYWYKRAADAGESLSQFEIGRRYENGIGVEADSVKAFHYYMLSAKQEERLARYALGICYEEGKGTASDAEEAVKWYSDLLDELDDITKDVLLRLAKLYDEGTLVKKDPLKAFGYYRKLADDYGDDAATYYVARGLENGVGCYKDEYKAEDYYYTLAQNNYRDSRRRYLMLALVKGNSLKGAYRRWIKEFVDRNDWEIKVTYALFVCKRGKSEFSGKQCRNARFLLEMIACTPKKKLFGSVCMLLDKIYLQLAECYRHGIGCRISMKKATKWYKKLEKKGTGPEAKIAGKELLTYAFAKERAAIRKKKGFLAMLCLTAIFLSVFLATMFIHMKRAKVSFASTLAYYNEQTVIWSSTVWYISLVFFVLCFVGTIISFSIYAKRRR